MRGETLIELQDVMVLRHTEPTGLFGLWGAKPIRALDGVSLTIARGETLGVMGSGGGGKSTLAETVALRRQPDRGRILVEGRDVAKLGGNERRRLQRRLQMIRQDPRDSLELDRSVRKQLSDQLRHAGLNDQESRINRALEQVELPPEFLDRTPQEMSGGQQQRTAIARALALGPILIAADEPVSGVDPVLRRELIKLFKEVQRRQNLAYLVVSHDSSLIRRMADRTAVLHAGRLFEEGPAERILETPHHPFSKAFFGTEPGGLPPEEEAAGRVIQGCPWASYCPVSSERCRIEFPALREVAAGHRAACHAL